MTTDDRRSVAVFAADALGALSAEELNAVRAVVGFDGFIDSIIRVVDKRRSMEPEDFARTARHTRLDQVIRLVDMLRFQAEHDDHHLARLRELRRAYG